MCEKLLKRTQGMTTGAMPTFIDISQNFAGTEIQEDNLLYQVCWTCKRVGVRVWPCGCRCITEVMYGHVGVWA